MKKLHVAGATLAALLASTAANAGWIGDTVQGNDVYNIPGYGWIYGGGQAATVVPGGASASGGLYNYSVTDHTLTLSVPGGGWSDIPFNGFLLTDLTGTPGIIGVSLLGSPITYTPTATWDSSNIWINFAGRSTGYGETYQFAVTFADDPAPAPEPASWAMMVGGFGLTGGAMRARRKQAAVRFA